MIEVKHLVKRFGPTVAVRDVSFGVKSGEVVGFLGPNGAGKTTTMRVLTCFLPADEGEATVAGYSVHDQPVDVRRNIGYLPENAPLYEEMGVVDYLEFIGEVRGMDADTRKRRLDAMIGICGLERVLQKDIGELSKGFRQRVGLAQALIHDPPILVLDEPTSGLDPHQIIEIRELIKTIGRAKTVILSTHILPEVTATCGRVLIINDGVLVADGSPEELGGQRGGGERILLTLRGPREEVNAALGAVERVTSWRELDSPGADLMRYELRSGDGRDACEELFRMAAERSWPISELHREASSLEEVFIELTKSEPGTVR
ncbi:MAG: ATP-binding cassette domain-containing protein [Candidatus Eiseniibacteriota bacterium]|jgi:ABC-2 type transport system ATP-binding protein